MKTYGHGGDIYNYEKRPIDFSSNINPLGMPQIAKKAILDNVDNFEIYPDHCARYLVKAIATKHKLNPKSISLGNGAADLIYRLCISQKPKRALVMAPSFSEYEEALALVNAQITHYKLDDSLMLDERIITATEGMDMVFICNPNNPTGIVMEEKLVIALEKNFRNTNRILVVDECFLDFSQDSKSFIEFVENNPNIVVLKAFTKFYAMAGIRLGYMLSSNNNINQLMAKYAPPWNISAVAQLAGEIALKDKEYEEKTREYVKREREYIIDSLENLGCKVYNSKANYVLFCYTKLPLKDLLLEKNILIRDCSNYHNLSKGHYRVAVKTQEENISLIKALKEVINNG